MQEQYILCKWRHRRSRKGAWIEIQNCQYVSYVTPSRSRKGAWIEIRLRLLLPIRMRVAPVRERGLKYIDSQEIKGWFSRSRKGAWIEICVCGCKMIFGMVVAPVRERGLK